MRRRPLIVSLVGTLVIAFGSLFATLIASNSPQLGLDLQGGASVTLQPVGSFDSDALDVVPDIYRARIDSLGVAEPEILRQGDTIVVNLPGVKDKDRAIELIGVTGKVVFRPVTNRIGPFAEPLDLSALDNAATASTVAGSATSTTAGNATSTTSAANATSTSAPAGGIPPAGQRNDDSRHHDTGHDDSGRGDSGRGGRRQRYDDSGHHGSGHGHDGRRERHHCRTGDRPGVGHHAERAGPARSERGAPES